MPLAALSPHTAPRSRTFRPRSARARAHARWSRLGQQQQELEERAPDLTRAAESGDADACLELAFLHQGLSDLESSRWFAQAAVLFRVRGELGEVRALHSLGLMYASGHGGHWNQEDAVLCFQRAAAEGYAPSLYELARAHATGLGAPLDHTRAEALLLEAAERGLRAACEALDQWWALH